MLFTNIRRLLYFLNLNVLGYTRATGIMIVFDSACSLNNKNVI